MRNVQEGLLINLDPSYTMSSKPNDMAQRAGKLSDCICNVQYCKIDS